MGWVKRGSLDLKKGGAARSLKKAIPQGKRQVIIFTCDLAGKGIH
jgi:hypothetical protein